jgi:hypothetical protein
MDEEELFLTDNSVPEKRPHVAPPAEGNADQQQARAPPPPDDEDEDPSALVVTLARNSLEHVAASIISTFQHHPPRNTRTVTMRYDDRVAAALIRWPFTLVRYFGVCWKKNEEKKKKKKKKKRIKRKTAWFSSQLEVFKSMD